MVTKTFDPKCYDLAQHFLEDDDCIGLDNEPNRNDLAAEIQNAIENWVDQKRQDWEPPDPPGWEAGFAKNH